MQPVGSQASRLETDSRQELERQNRELRRGLRDLVALAGMPAAWVGRELSQIAQGVLDLLVSTLRLDAACVRITGLENSPVVEARAGHSWPEFDHWLHSALPAPPLHKPDLFAAPITLPSADGRRTLRVTLCPIGLKSGDGLVAVASCRPDFPTEMDLLLLSVAANQAAIALQTARLMAAQQQVEAALRRSKAELEDFVENANVGLHWVGPDGTILWANKAELDLLGYSREEYVGHPIKEFHADEPVIEDILVRLGRGEELRDYEARMRARDGSLKNVLIRSSVYRENGRFVHTRCFTLDVTARRQAEQELSAQHVLLRTVTQNAAASLFFMDPHGRCTYMNPAAEQMSGFTFAEIQAGQQAGKTLHDMIHHTYPDGRPFPISECPIDRALPQTQTVQGYEAVFIRKDGTFYPVVSSASPILERGRPVGTVVEVRDVTAGKAAQEALQVNEERLRAALAASNAGTFRWDIPTNGLWWDDNLYGLFGLPPGGRVNRLEQLTSAVHPDDRAAVFAALDRCTSRGDDLDLEFRVVWPDGSIHWLLDRGRMFLDEQGKPAYMTGACIDVTERKLADQALHNSEKLAATGRLAATIAHEINNPLESVTNLIYLVKGDPSLSDEARRELELADQELARITHIAQQTLGFYRDTSDPASVDLARLLEDVLSLYERRLSYKNLRVRLEIRTHVPVRCQQGEIRQVLSNLLANAIDASPRDGVLRIRLADGRSRGAVERAGVCIVIGDGGDGILPQHRSSIFQPFFTTKKAVGTGLGLWVTRTMIENHHGSVRFRSSVATGRSGTVFRVFLPCARPEPARRVS